MDNRGGLKGAIRHLVLIVLTLGVHKREKWYAWHFQMEYHCS